jgi:hypothetical protein
MTYSDKNSVLLECFTFWTLIRYFQGGREGVFVIPDGSVINKNISLGSYDTANDAMKGIRFIRPELLLCIFFKDMDMIKWSLVRSILVSAELNSKSS